MEFLEIFRKIKMLKIPEIKVPIVEIPIDKKVQLFMKREDLIHPKISGNKYWKLFYNVNSYLEKRPKNPLIITFGGAFSNHIASVAAFGKEFGIKTLGIIRGEELKENFLQNPTLKFAYENEMHFRFVSREHYRHKMELKFNLTNEFPSALILEEGGTNELAVQGIQHMLNEQTKDFDYLCAAVGTGGTLAGISKFCEEHQHVLGFKVVKDDSLENIIFQLSEKRNFKLIETEEKYGKITEENVRFINQFFEQFQIPLEPIYTSKMMMRLLKLIDEDYFPENSRILAIHTGGLQGIEGANLKLLKQNKELIKINSI